MILSPSLQSHVHSRKANGSAATALSPLHHCSVAQLCPSACPAASCNKMLHDCSQMLEQGCCLQAAAAWILVWRCPPGQPMYFRSSCGIHRSTCLECASICTRRQSSCMQPCPLQLLSIWLNHGPAAPFYAEVLKTIHRISFGQVDI